MNNQTNEDSIIVEDVVATMEDYVSIQPDIDDTKIKSAWLVAQKIDMKRSISDEMWNKVLEPHNPTDEALKYLVVQATCYFCYYRCLKMFQGTFTDSGFEIEQQATDRNTAKSIANEFYSIGEVFLKDVLSYIEEKYGVSTADAQENLTPRIRVFGGEENRS